MADDQNAKNETAQDTQQTCTAVPTPAIPGIQPNTTMIVPCFICDIHVTPAPTQIYGNINYYYDPSKNVGGSGFKSRYFDFLARHPSPQVCGHTVPDYYLGYGDKYIKKFTTELYPKLSQTGKSWLLIARQKLQEYMEDGFKQNVNSDQIIIQQTKKHAEFKFYKLPSLECLELNNKRFKDFAFWTHPPAYLDGGFDQMTAKDKAEIMNTVNDGGDFWSLDTMGQMWHTGWEEFKHGDWGSTLTSVKAALWDSW